MNIVVFDTETTGIPLRPKPGEPPIFSSDPRQPRILQFAAIKYTGTHDAPVEVSRIDALIKPDGWEMPPEIVAFNEKHNTGITMERLHAEGRPILQVLDEFRAMFDDAEVIVAHNNSFDIKMVRIELTKNGYEGEVADNWRDDNRHFCTMKESTAICQIPASNTRWGPYKSPKLTEAYLHFMGKPMEGEHQGINDAIAAAEIYFKLCGAGCGTPKPKPVQPQVSTETIGF